MLFQINANQEWQFLFYLIPVIFGIQLALYFFYQYYKIQDVKLQLNRVLLSYGSFILFTVLGAFFLVNTRLIEFDLYLEVILSKIGYVSVFFSPIGFMAFIINTKEFSKIIHLKISKILTILNLIPVIAGIIVPTTDSPIFRVSIIFMVINALNLIYIQLKLIKLSFGIIKTKLKQFFIGEILALIALIFAAQVLLNILPGVTTETSFFIGVALLTIGFLIIFSAVYDFPPFYEFEWKSNLLKLFIINQKTKSCLFYYNFSEYFSQNNNISEKKSETNQSELDTLFSGGIIGIEEMISMITGTEKEKINKIEQSDSFIFLEYGTNPAYLNYVLLVRKDLNSYGPFLNFVKSQFESFFREILLNLDDLKGNQELLFGSFNIIIKSMIKQ